MTTMTITTTKTTNTLDDITDNARLLADARAHLGELMHALSAGLEALKADSMPDIRNAIVAATAAWQALELSIQINPQLFVQPRTVSAHGITFGLEKGKGAITIGDPDKTCALIRKHLPEQADVLIALRETPVKKALAQLSARDLQRIGASVTDAGDRVVIRPAPSDVDKLVRALVRTELDEAEAT